MMDPRSHSATTIMHYVIDPMLVYYLSNISGLCPIVFCFGSVVQLDQRQYSSRHSSCSTLVIRYIKPMCHVSTICIFVDMKTCDQLFILNVNNPIQGATATQSHGTNKTNPILSCASDYTIPIPTFRYLSYKCRE